MGDGAQHDDLRLLEELGLNAGLLRPVAAGAAGGRPPPGARSSSRRSAKDRSRDEDLADLAWEDDIRDDLGSSGLSDVDEESDQPSSELDYGSGDDEGDAWLDDLDSDELDAEELRLVRAACRRQAQQSQRGGVRLALVSRCAVLGCTAVPSQLRSWECTSCAPPVRSKQNAHPPPPHTPGDARAHAAGRASSGCGRRRPWQPPAMCVGQARGVWQARRVGQAPGVGKGCGRGAQCRCPG